MSEKVKRTLALDDYANDYLVGMTPDEAEEYVAGLDPDYNGWTREGALRLLTAVNRLIPPCDYPEWNTNNGRQHHRFKVGREGSRVLYVWINKGYLTHKVSGHRFPPWTPDDFVRLVSSFNGLGRRHEADEAAMSRNDPPDRFGTPGILEFRWWWD